MSGVNFPKFWPLDARIQKFGPQIRILRAKSPLELDSEVWNRVSRQKHDHINSLTRFFKPDQRVKPLEALIRYL